MLNSIAFWFCPAMKKCCNLIQEEDDEDDDDDDFYDDDDDESRSPESLPLEFELLEGSPDPIAVKEELDDE